MAALTSCGTIPETGDYSVLLEPQVEAIGTVNEDFAVESLSGDVFQLGNASYRILRVEPGRVRVEDARGEIRAGRFIGGLLGEQFALPEAIGLLRQVRRQPHDGAWLCVAAADPANLPGSVLPGSRGRACPPHGCCTATACRWRPGSPSVSSRCRN
ncbi:Conserved hypothetical protein [Xanthomonas translucens pv. translucens DSM 18974]|uniref:Helicase Lhr-like winged helix domain-containing protein n=1 Tax=Xanthomonas translucens pv. translucens DSM 18974 TaxID=1261556 RepID=A0A1C3TQ12_XANCT|nr:putative ATP-dependent helicase MTH_1802 [Xanthomonas translucens pv. translucens DSM 18974]SCB05307.1 Conserved hypothetical protein [Xanthomonas translucens pv. translucens DSM 18974]